MDNNRISQTLKRIWIGPRTVKTAVAVFITAMICKALGLPVVFAVITAIVTLEPTASDSIKKGMVRLPASAIGAALAVIFVAIFGDAPLTFTLAATLTILICDRLNLRDGILVATLTAVAMIPDIHDHFFLAFLTRLGTTTIGLTVSTLVNIFLLPPKYINAISLRTKKQLDSFQQVFSDTILELTNNLSGCKEKQSLPLSSYINWRKRLEKIQELVTYQEKEWKFHRVNRKEYREFFHEKKKLLLLQKLHLHLGRLQYVKKPIDFNDYEIKLLLETTNSIIDLMNQLDNAITDEHFYYIYEMDQYLKYEYSSGHRKNPDYFHHFHMKTIIFYEILCIHDSIEELHHYNRKSLRPPNHKTINKNRRIIYENGS